MIVKSLPFPEVPFDEVGSDVTSPLWDCRDAEWWNLSFHITSKPPWSQTSGLCNLGQVAGAHLLHANPWRWPPYWTTRGGVVQIWPRDHQCCSYSVASSSVCVCHGNVFLMCSYKRVIEYDLYVKLPQMFAHNVQICAIFSCKNFTDVCPVFWLLCHYTQGAVTSWTRCIYFTLVLSQTLAGPCYNLKMRCLDMLLLFWPETVAVS